MAPNYESDDSGTDEESVESAEEVAPKKISVLVTFSHPDAAVKFLASFQNFAGRLDERYSQIRAYMFIAIGLAIALHHLRSVETGQEADEKYMGTLSGGNLITDTPTS